MNCSYLFEFNGYECDWWSVYDASVDKNNDTVISWFEAKSAEVAAGVVETGADYGNRVFKFSPGVVPVVRCYWHCGEPYLEENDYVLNVLRNYAVKHSVPRWYVTFGKEVP